MDDLRGIGLKAKRKRKMPKNAVEDALVVDNRRARTTTRKRRKARLVVTSDSV
jgi:hypothetical protein